MQSFLVPVVAAVALLSATVLHGCGGGGNEVSGMTCLFVVGDMDLTASGAGSADVWFKAQLEAAGYMVTAVEDDTVAAGTYVAPTTYDLVAVSASVVSGKVGDKFKNVPSMFLSWEEGIYDEMGMTKMDTGTKKNVENSAASGFWRKSRPDYDYAYADSLTSVSMVSANSDCALAAGKTGTVAVFSQPYGMSWGRPGSAAMSIATIETPSPGSTRSVIFSYSSGDTLADGTAAAGRRVACFPYHFGSGNLPRPEAWYNETVEAKSPADGTVPLTADGQALVRACIAMDTSCAGHGASPSS